jgi:hypothetical protein
VAQRVRPLGTVSAMGWGIAGLPIVLCQAVRAGLVRVGEQTEAMDFSSQRVDVDGPQKTIKVHVNGDMLYAAPRRSLPKVCDEIWNGFGRCAPGRI